MRGSNPARRETSIGSTEVRSARGLCNKAPDCSAAAASMDAIWPPNHKFVPVDVLGVTVCVPHDQGNASSCVDGGPLIDSTL
jgi:hypothetical protein